MSAADDPIGALRDAEAKISRLTAQVKMTEESTLSRVAAWLNARGHHGVAKRIHPDHGDEVRTGLDRDKFDQFKWDLNKTESQKP